MIKIFDDVNFDKSKFLNKKSNNYESGYYKGFYCRSSYEKKFVDFCEKYKLKLESAENNKFVIEYEAEEGKIRKYFPDFYLPDNDLVIEIKPLSMYDYKFNLEKYDSASKQYKFMIITEDDGLFDSWDSLYEEINYA